MSQQEGDSAAGFAGGSREARALVDEAGSIAGEVRDLLKLQTDLAKAELRESTTKAARGAGLGAAGLVLGHTALIFFCLALMFGLDNWLPLWAAALATALLLVVVGALLGLLAYLQVRRVSFVPERFVRSLKEDWSWAKSLVTSKAR